MEINLQSLIGFDLNSNILIGATKFGFIIYFLAKCLLTIYLIHTTILNITLSY